RPAAQKRFTRGQFSLCCVTSKTIQLSRPFPIDLQPALWVAIKELYNHQHEPYPVGGRGEVATGRRGAQPAATARALHRRGTERLGSGSGLEAERAARVAAPEDPERGRAHRAHAPGSVGPL